MNKLKKHVTLGIVSLICLNLVNCATDQQATKTGGTVIGAGLGAVIGGLAGGLAAKMSGGDVRQGVAIGVATGMVAGGIRGHQWGTAVAKKKEQYARTEDYLCDSIQDARILRKAAETENTRLVGELSRLRSKQDKLKAAYAHGQISQSQLRTEKNAIDAMVADAAKKVGRINEEIAIQTSARQQAGNDTSLAAKNASDEEVKLLSQQRNALQVTIASLGGVSDGYSIGNISKLASPTAGAPKNSDNAPQSASVSPSRAAVRVDSNGTQFLGGL